MLTNKNIVVGVSGGIAAYKTVELVSRLKKLGANIDIIMTKNATEFVSELTFRTLSNRPVYVDMFDRPISFDVEHISLAEKADIFILAPATANLIGKIANGIADDLLTTTVMATQADVIFAPAMNSNMYMNPIVEENIKYLKDLGYRFINPGTGLLACKTVGPGRMAEAEEIADYIIDFLEEEKKEDLSGRKIIITAGPTVEEIDSVRYLSNYSSGKMGYELAKEAEKRGAEVVLVAGPTNLEDPKDIKILKVRSADEMLKAIEEEFDSSDVLIKAAAVADYRVKNKSDKKIKKMGEEFSLDLIENVDIAKYFGEKKGDRILVGFAAETDRLETYAREKLYSKKLDFIVANDISREGAGFDLDTNIVTIIDKKEEKEYPIMEKKEVANIILDKITKELDGKAR